MFYKRLTWSRWRDIIGHHQIQQHVLGLPILWSWRWRYCWILPWIPAIPGQTRSLVIRVRGTDVCFVKYVGGKVASTSFDGIVSWDDGIVEVHEPVVFGRTETPSNVCPALSAAVIHSEMKILKFRWMSSGSVDQSNPP